MFQIPEIGITPMAQVYSDTQFEILKKYIQEYENSLDSEHEVGIMLTHMGNP